MTKLILAWFTSSKEVCVKLWWWEQLALETLVKYKCYKKSLSWFSPNQRWKYIFAYSYRPVNASYVLWWCVYQCNIHPHFKQRNVCGWKWLIFLKIVLLINYGYFWVLIWLTCTSLIFRYSECIYVQSRCMQVFNWHLMSFMCFEVQQRIPRYQFGYLKLPRD